MAKCRLHFSNSMRKQTIKALILCGILALLLALIPPATLHRRDFNRAFMAWWKDKSPANEAELRRQQAINTRLDLIMRGSLAFVLFVVFAGLFFGWNYLQSKRLGLRA
jgi:hypothetical protein